MLQVTIDDIRRRLALDNPWWSTGSVYARFRGIPRRDYFEPLMALIDAPVNRSIVVMGPRRVGKTVLLHQVIATLLERGIEPGRIMHVPLDVPVYDGIGLERFMLDWVDRAGRSPEERFYVFFDEVQYLQDWEIHLKTLHDAWPGTRFIVSGSAAAALRRKSRESGAGRFTDFILPPLTFREYLRLSRLDDLPGVSPDTPPADVDIDALNGALVDYINTGGFPEIVVNAATRADSERYIRQDIIDNVLLRDLPSLYGIQDVQELNRFFATLAYNTGQEVSMDELAKSSQVSKNTLRRYLEYLEAAFLIVTVDRVDHQARRFQRRTHFKVYLTNPCIRAALFGATGPDDPAMGALVETALFAQWAHWPAMQRHLTYARWRGGYEVDLVYLYAEKPRWCLEVKWSDRFVDRPAGLKGLVRLAEHPSEPRLEATTRSRWAETGPPPVHHRPAAVEILRVGSMVTDGQIREYLKLAT